MSKETDNSNSAVPEPLYDVGGNVIEVSTPGGMVRLWGWHVTEDSYGRPYQTSADQMEFTPRKAIELARRLFMAAPTEETLRSAKASDLEISLSE